MPKPYEFIPDDLKKQAEEEAKKQREQASAEPRKDIPPGHHRQRRIFKRTRGGIVLSREEVAEIKAGRKKLKADMRARGIRDKEQFELVAASLGLYFDKRRGLLFWLLRGRGLWALLGAALLLLLAFYLLSLVSQLRGYFTINLSDGLFREGFVLSETEDFRNPTTALYCEPVVDVPCISITQIEEGVDDDYEGQHNSDYFAYTFWVRNEGESTVDYEWTLELNDEGKNLSDAAWVMVFEDGDMMFYAEKNRQTGGPEALPAFGDDSRGFIKTPLIGKALHPEEQYRPMASKGNVSYYRLVPYPFEGDDVVTTGIQFSVEPWNIHKYTVVIWVEGDDVDTDNSKIGGHLGLDMQFRLLDEEKEDGRQSFLQRLFSQG